MVGFLFVILGATTGAEIPVPPSPPRWSYEIQGELTSVSGRRVLARPQLTALSGAESTFEVLDGSRRVAIAALVSPTPERGCHAVQLKLSVVKLLPDGKEISHKVKGATLHCGTGPVAFQGLDSRAVLSSDLRLTIAVSPKIPD